MRIIDLTQTIVNQMQVYPGDQPPTLVQTHHIPNNGFTNHLLTTGMHAGTHIDGTWHMIDNHSLIANTSLESLIGKGCLIDIRNFEIFSDAQLVYEKATGCSIILFYTGYGAFFGTTKYLAGRPSIANNVAEVMVQMGIKLMGIDTLSPDTEPYEIHKTLLGNNVLIAENLTNLHLLLEVRDFDIIALPLKVAADSAPARIVAMVK